MDCSTRGDSELIGKDRGKKSVATTFADVATKNLADWRQLFSASPDQSLQYFPPSLENGQLLVQPPDDIFEEGINQWKHAVVVQFIGRIPNYSYFQRMVNILWGKDGEVDLRPVGSNLFIVQFPNLETRDRVLESGPWHIQNQPLIVRKWEPGMKSLEFNMSKLPIWIQLRNIPLELFTQKGLSYIASAVGVPLYMDHITAKQQRLAFAKVCIEIEAMKDIPNVIEVKLRDGSVVSVSVEIPWRPLKCLHCGIFGHSDKACSQKPLMTKVWVPKEKVAKVAQELVKKADTTQAEANVGAISIERGKKNAIEVANSPSTKAGSANRFAMLDTISDNKEIQEADIANYSVSNEEVSFEPRKARVAAAGVAELMKTLKTKKKGPIDKGKKQNKVGSTTLREITGLLTAVHKDYFRVINYRELLFDDCGDRVAQLLHVELATPAGCFTIYTCQEILIVNTHFLFPQDLSLCIVRLHQVYKILEYVEFYKEYNLNCLPTMLNHW